jgi:hypothetical protein
MIYKMPNFQQKLKDCKEIRKYGSYSGPKKGVIDITPEEAQIFDLLDKDIKLAIINRFM